MGGAISKSELVEANARLCEEAQEMKRQLETRKVVERAKGILQQRYSLIEEDAYLRLHNESRRRTPPDEGSGRGDHLLKNSAARNDVAAS